MSNMAKSSIVIGLVVLVGVVLALKGRRSSCPFLCNQAPAGQVVAPAASEQAEDASASAGGVADASVAEGSAVADGTAGDASGVAGGGAASLPRLVDLGASTCIPCRMMEPILESLRQEYAGRLQVEFYDIRQEKEALSRFKVRVIPTQIFYDGQGQELWRHEGFLGKEAILAKWQELGVELGSASGQP